MQIIKLIQVVREVKASHLVGKTGALILFGLSLIIVAELFRHGQIALGAYMLVERLMGKSHHSDKSEAAEHVVHVTAHGNTY